MPVIAYIIYKVRKPSMTKLGHTTLDEKWMYFSSRQRIVLAEGSSSQDIPRVKGITNRWFGSFLVVR